MKNAKVLSISPDPDSSVQHVELTCSVPDRENAEWLSLDEKDVLDIKRRGKRPLYFVCSRHAAPKK